MTTTLIVPGLRSSGLEHWQTWFEHRIPGSVRVIQRDWSHADLPEWSSRVRREINRIPGRIIIVAHSFGVLAAVQAAEDHKGKVAGALLVAPADPDKLDVADYLPARPLSFKSVIVASTNDPWMTLERAAYWADRWDSELVNLGAVGHINVESGFGPWPEGLSLLEKLRRSVTRQSEQPAAVADPAHRPAAWRSDHPRLAGARRDGRRIASDNAG